MELVMHISNVKSIKDIITKNEPIITTISRNHELDVNRSIEPLN